MSWLKRIEKSIGEIVEISLLLIALGVAIEILFGDVAPFFGQVTTNLIGLLSTLGENGFVGLIASGIIFFLFYRMVGLPVTNGQKKQVAQPRKGKGTKTKRAYKTR